MQASGGFVLWGGRPGIMYYTTAVITTMPATPYTAALYNSNAPSMHDACFKHKNLCKRTYMSFAGRLGQQERQ